MSEKCLTSVHADVVKLSLASKCFTSPILELLNINYNEISREATSNTKSLLLFFYYGGMIAASVKVNSNVFLFHEPISILVFFLFSENIIRLLMIFIFQNYSRALYLLEACITIPATAVSHIMLEAYKKYLMIWLIVHGDMSQEALTFPKYTSGVVNKYIRALSAPYWEVVRAFYSSNLNDLKTVIEKHSSLFNDDGNTGLVAQVVVARQKTSIKRLTKTFLTLSLEDVAARVGLESPQAAEMQLVSMIEEGSIFARISQQDGKISTVRSALKLKKVQFQKCKKALFAFSKMAKNQFLHQKKG